MEKLRSTIAEHGRWVLLTEFVDRVEAYQENDFSTAIENAKALLESIGKEICQDKGVELGTQATTNEILKGAFKGLGLGNSEIVSVVSRSLGAIGQKVGELRNEICATPHGMTLEQLKERNGKVDRLTRDFLLDSTAAVSVFLIGAYEQQKQGKSEERLDYDKASDFNDYFDDLYGEVEIGNYSYSASEILYNVDYNAYRTEHDAFMAEPEQEETP